MPDKYLIQKGVETRVSLPHTITEAEASQPGVHYDAGQTTDLFHDVVGWVDMAAIAEDELAPKTYWSREDVLNCWLDETYGVEAPERQGLWRCTQINWILEQETKPVTELQTETRDGRDVAIEPQLPVVDLDIPF